MKAEETIHYYDILKECFESDPSLINKWHIKAGNGLDMCVEQTFKDLLHCKVKFFKVTKNKDLIGYFGHENFDGNDYLTGFFVKPKYRTLNNEFWNLILEHIKRPFLVGLYNKNLPAIDFIKSHGGQVILRIDTEDKSGTLFRIGA